MGGLCGCYKRNRSIERKDEKGREEEPIKIMPISSLMNLTNRVGVPSSPN